jgi:molybdenum cofactor cytidylyltransferase
VNHLHALVLAAGSGSRFGGRKLLSPWRGGVLLDGALAAALAAPVGAALVVVGADAAEAAAAALALAERDGQGARLRIVLAPDYSRGLSASLRAGLAALPAEADGVLVFLGDMPVIPLAVLEPLAAALRGGAPAAVPAFDGQRGHPVAISRALFAELMTLRGDRGAGAVLDALGDRLVVIPTDDPGVLLDVDRPGEAPP